MSQVIIAGDTSGTITLQAPAVSGSTTITLPAATGTMMVSGNMPAFSAYQSSAQTLSSGTFTKIQFQTKEFDTASAFDNTTNYRFTPQVAGYYQVTGGIAIGSSACYQLVTFYKNNSEFKRVQYTNSSAVNNCSGTTLIYLNGSTDYIELYALIQTGQALNASASTTYFQAILVRTA